MDQVRSLKLNPSNSVGADAREQIERQLWDRGREAK